MTTAPDEFLTPTWRAEALSLLYSQLQVRVTQQRILPLSVMCLLPLLASGGCTIRELKEDVLPFIPQHLRREAVRYLAIKSPLSAARLFSLYEDEGHADGEIIVVGPNATMRDDYFIQPKHFDKSLESEHPQASTSTSKNEPDSSEEDWDDEDAESPKLLQVFAALSTRLSMSTILSLPPTLTHLALIHLSLPIYPHRLPRTCPLLVFLDLSYNEWLERPSIEIVKSVARIEWTRWSHLQTLGWRKCVMFDEMQSNINKGRWNDVVVLTQHDE